MVFQLPPAKKSRDQDLFKFTFDGKKEYSVPLIQYLSPADAAAFESASLGQQKTVFEKYAPGAFDKIPGGRVTDDGKSGLQVLIEAWAAESGVSVGESGASADS